MEHVAPLPDLLAERYCAWRSARFEERRQAYEDLVLGQAPAVMIITCCDSRVMVAEMFGAEAGDYFVHRNIAAFVPPTDAPSGAHGTLSTIEYAVRTLAVRHILVVGHTGCGGVEGAHDLCEGSDDRPEEPHGFVGEWLRALCPAYEAARALRDRASRIAAMEREVVRLSLRNLLGIGFVAEAARTGCLTLHGALWDLRAGRLEVLDAASESFQPFPA
jgi:carbonic anhydrase